MKQLCILHHKKTGQEVSIFGFVPFTQGGEPMGGDFLIYTTDGWDFRPVAEFKPATGICKLELEKDSG